MTENRHTLDGQIYRNLKLLYGDEAKPAFKAIKTLMNKFQKLRNKVKRNTDKISQRDTVLITYADTFQRPNELPFKTLSRFVSRYISGTINTIHILPFYKWDIDRGFSVLDYLEIDPRNGNWGDFQRLNKIVENLMVDLVLNHASINNPMVQGALTHNEKYNNFVITFSDQEKPPKKELQKIIRPRETPLLTKYYVFEKDNSLWASFNPSKGEATKIKKSGWVWTTFSRSNDPEGVVRTKQVDLNFRNPKVLVEMIRILLNYVTYGAKWIRLDAVPYLWKEIGTSSIHLPQVHTLLQIINQIVNTFDSRLVLIAEINEKQEDVFSYLGSKSKKEADLVYQFTHFPMAVYSLLTGDGSYYAKWLNSLEAVRGTQFVTVYGSHDGMGLKPIGNWLPKEELNWMIKRLIERHGARPNYSRITGGKKVIYELCATPWSLVNEINSRDKLDIQIKRYISILTLGFSIRGIPAIYINGLLGTANNTGHLDENRTINREIFQEESLFKKLDNPSTIRSLVLNKCLDLIKIRTNESAFHPLGPKINVESDNPSIVSTILESPTYTEKISSLVNVSHDPQEVKIDFMKGELTSNLPVIDLITRNCISIDIEEISSIKLEPYQTLWLKSTDNLVES